MGRVPWGWYAGLALALALQIIWHGRVPAPIAAAEALPPPPRTELLAAAFLGEKAAASRLVMLWLQNFDNQPGISIPFSQLDYGRVIGWLEVASLLDPRSQYPFLAASRLYGEVPDRERSRAMSEWIFAHYGKDPARRWPWLAHVTVVAKHRHNDQARAIKYARALADTPDNGAIPAWARQLEWTILEAAGELDAARVVIGGLLTSGTVTDPRELQLLNATLERLERQRSGSGLPQGQPD